MVQSIVAFVVGLGLGSLFTYAEAPGFYLTGHASATDTDKAEQMIAIGQDIIVQVRDQGLYDRQVAPLVGHVVRFCLVEERVP